MPQNVESKALLLPEDLVDKATKRQERPKSEFLPEAVPQHVTESDWRQLLQYGAERATAKNIRPEDVAHLVEEYRAEVATSRT